jgi:hypothetical protein
MPEPFFAGNSMEVLCVVTGVTVSPREHEMRVRLWDGRIVVGTDVSAQWSVDGASCLDVGDPTGVHELSRQLVRLKGSDPQSVDGHTAGAMDDVTGLNLCIEGLLCNSRPFVVMSIESDPPVAVRWEIQRIP